MLRMCGTVEGRKVLDVGCGEGRFCRMLRDRGADTVGIDPTPPLLGTARERDPDGSYLLGKAEQLPFEDASFDILVFYLTLIDIPDFRTAIKEAGRVLKPGGRMVIGNLAPHASTSAQGWVRDANGKKLYYPIDRYSDEFAQVVEWAGIRVVNYHRPLNAYMQSFLGEGLVLREYLEPVPTEEQAAANPELEYERRAPYLVAMLWEKA